MINTSEFASRLKKIIDFYDESASSFAETIGVQRSSISHILSGRNKPSLDFVMKILHSYPEVDLYWLMNGTGNFPKTEYTSPPSNDLFSTDDIMSSKITDTKNENLNNSVEKEIVNLEPVSNSKSEIERIVIFFKDGTFKNYNQ